MPLVDDRGRLFGRINLIDGIVLSLVVLAIPLAYGAYALFKPALPEITAVEPSSIPADTQTRISVTGKNLRPFLDAFIDTTNGTFLLQTPGLAEVVVPRMPPGTYSLSLFSEGQRVAFRPGALTVVAPPAPVAAPPDAHVQAVGAFVSPDRTQTALLKPGARFPDRGDSPWVEVLAVKAPEPVVQQVGVGPTSILIPLAGRFQVPAILRVGCTIADGRCRVGGAFLERNAVLPLPGTPGLSFRVDEVRDGASPVAFVLPTVVAPADLVVQVVGTFVALDSRVARMIRAGLRLPPGVTPPPVQVLVVKPPEPAVHRIFLGGRFVSIPVPGKQQIPAILQVGCTLVQERCRLGDVAFEPSAIVPLRFEPHALSFLVETVRDAGTPLTFPSVRTAVARMVVRFVVRPQVFELVKVGEKAVATPATPGAPIDAAVVERLGTPETLRSLVSIDLEPDPTRAQRAFHQVEQPVTSFVATVRAEVREAPTGWQHNGNPIRMGGLFVFDTGRYALRGWVEELTIAPAETGGGPRP